VPRVGDAITKFGEEVQTNILDRIGGSLEDINGISHDIRTTTIPQINDTILTIQQAVNSTQTVQTTTIIFLIVFTLTCIAIIILIIYYIYRDMNRGTVYQVTHACHSIIFHLKYYSVNCCTCTHK
jgi:Na+/H+-translocating membrane pyrophosphatase